MRLLIAILILAFAPHLYMFALALIIFKLLFP